MATDTFLETRLRFQIYAFDVLYSRFFGVVVLLMDLMFYGPVNPLESCRAGPLNKQHISLDIPTEKQTVQTLINDSIQFNLVIHTV